MWYKRDARLVMLDREPGDLCRLPYPNYPKGAGVQDIIDRDANRRMERQAMRKTAAEIRTPFHDKRGKLRFPVQATRHVAFIWPTPPPETFGELGILDIPEKFREEHQDGTGILLSIGSGYWGKHKKKPKWYSPPEVLVPGIRVFFDVSVPWSAMFQGQDGEMHKVVYCGYRDIHGLAI